MLFVSVGKQGRFDGCIDNKFYSNMEPEWFNDPFVKRMVLEIDKSEIVSPYLIQSPVLGPINFERLSGGVKCLILMYKRTDLKLWGSLLGENCLSLLNEIGQKVDVHTKFSHVPLSCPPEFHAIFEPDGKEVITGNDFMLELAKRI